VTGHPTALIIRPQPSRSLGAFYRNLGLTMLASYVRAAGLQAQLIDLSFDRLSQCDARARAALFSLYIDDFAEGTATAAALRAANPAITTFVGGPHVTLLGEESLEVSGAFDVVGVGDCLPEAMPLVAAAAHGRAGPPGITVAVIRSVTALQLSVARG